MSSVMVEQALDRELSGSERMLWSGIPRQGFVLRSSDAFFVPFSLLWGGFVVFWEHGAISSHAPPFMVLWGVPFVLVGVYVIFGRFFVDRYQRSRIHYAVTDERVLIIRGSANREVKSLPLQTLSEITMRERTDGSGTITFGPLDPRYAMWTGMGSPWPGLGKRLPPSFELIPNVRSVYDTIRDAQASDTRGRR